MKPIQQNVKCHLAIFNGMDHFEKTTSSNEGKKQSHDDDDASSLLSFTAIA